MVSDDDAPSSSAKAALTQQLDPQQDFVLLRIYEAPDGFRGTYGEVLAHEEKLDIAKGHEAAVGKSDSTVIHLYEVSRSDMDRPYSVALHVRFRLRLIILFFCSLLSFG
jgi:hypothetical protein